MATCFCGPIQEIASLRMLSGIALYGVRTFLNPTKHRTAIAWSAWGIRYYHELRGWATGFQSDKLIGMSKFSFLNKLLWAGVHVATLGLMAVTLGGFLGRLWWILDLLAHFRVQYLVVALLLLAVSALGKRAGWSILSAGLALINLSLIVPLFIPVHAVDVESPEYRLFLYNVLTSNPQHERTRQFIEESDADFVALLEVNQNWLDDLRLEELGYVHSILMPRSDNFGISLYSRYLIEDAQIIYLDIWELPVIVARIILDEQPTTLVLVHTVPPKNEKLTQVRNAQMDALTDYVSHLAPPFIAAGDFNVTSWSPYFGSWMDTANLWDSRLGFGVQPTWMGIHPLFSIPIDHILISEAIQVHAHHIGPDIGSDHLPVIVDFSIIDTDTLKRTREHR